MPAETDKPEAVQPAQAKPASTRALPPTAYADRMEEYTPERIAEFLLNNAVGQDDYAAAVAEVRKLGIDPAAIAHQPPPGA